MVDNIIYELWVICRSGCEQKYPFTVYTQSRYLFPTFAEAKAAISGLVQENSAKEWISVYRYEIYTFELGKEIQTDYDTRDALDTTIYLPNGTRWISKGKKGVVEVGKNLRTFNPANFRRKACWFVHRGERVKRWLHMWAYHITLRV